MQLLMWSGQKIGTVINALLGTHRPRSSVQHAARCEILQLHLETILCRRGSALHARLRILVEGRAKLVGVQKVT